MVKDNICCWTCGKCAMLILCYFHAKLLMGVSLCMGTIRCIALLCLLLLERGSELLSVSAVENCAKHAKFMVVKAETTVTLYS